MKSFPTLTLLIALLMLAQSQADQKKKAEQDQPIRISTSLVEVRAVVTDPAGKAVTGLRAEDFEVLEDKTPQEIGFFSAVTVGSSVITSASEATAPTAPASSTRGPVPTTSPSRTVVLFVDNIHMTDANLLFARQALKKFIAESITGEDLTALMTSGSSLGLFSQFTRDKRLLSMGVDKIGAVGTNRNTLFTPYLSAQIERNDQMALRLGIATIAQEEGMSGPPQVMESYTRARARQVLSEAAYQRSLTLNTLKALTERLATLPGQRLIVMLSDGFTLFDRSAGYDTYPLQEITSKAAVSGVVIYTIETRGLEPPAIADASQRGPVGMPGAQMFLNGERTENQNVMNALARDTGGEPIRNTNDIKAGMKRSLDENSVYYSIGYYPASEEAPKKLRKLTVRVKSHPEYKVRAQQGYIPAIFAKANAEDAARTPKERLLRAMVSPLASSGIGIYATADFIETEADDAQVTLQVYIDGGKLQYRQEEERRKFDLDLLAVVFNSTGSQVTGKETEIRSKLLPATYEAAKSSGYRFTTRVPLQPGFYQIRIGVREPDTDLMGTAAAWVQVPDTRKKKLALSNILFTDPSGLDHLVALGKESITLQTGTRQGIRVFKPNETLAYYIRLYNPPPKTLVYQLQITQGDKVLAEAPWKPIPESNAANTKGIELGRMFTLVGLSPGFYELRVKVKEEKEKKSIDRDITFEVTR